MSLSLSQIWDLWKIVKQALGLVKQAERIVEDKPQAMANPITPSGQIRDETDPKDEYHLNQ